MTAVVVALLAALDAGVVDVTGTYPNDARMWGELVSRAERFTLPPATVAVAPHHLIDGFELAGFWRALSANQPSVVVLLAPDHFLKGRGVTAARRVRWPTAFGALRGDEALGSLLGASNDSIFAGEHSVHVHAPFVKRFLPNARFVPVLLRWETTRAELELLIERLDAVLPADALVVASVDFSHYQPEPWASFHDESSLASVTSLDVEGVFEREVDSPEALFVAMKFAERRGARHVTRVLHTNSQRRREVLVMDSTSHQYFVMQRGEAQPQRAITVTVTGEVPANAGLSVTGPWRWSPDRDAGMPSQSALSSIRGQEDRFFMGPDATLFSLPLGERVERTVRGQRLVLAHVDVTKPLPKFDGDCVVVLASGPTTKARSLFTRGVHVVVGRGAGAKQPLEFIDGGVFAASLGPFIGSAGRGRVLGVTCADGTVRVHSVPIVVRDGTPRLDAETLDDERTEKN